MITVNSQNPKNAQERQSVAAEQDFAADIVAVLEPEPTELHSTQLDCRWRSTVKQDALAGLQALASATYGAVASEQEHSHSG
jgi:hypothetical protein